MFQDPSSVYADPQDYARESGNLETDAQVYVQPDGGGVVPNPQDYNRESFEPDTGRLNLRMSRGSEHTVVHIIEEEQAKRTDNASLNMILIIVGTIVVAAVTGALIFCCRGGKADTGTSGGAETFVFTQPGEWVYFTPKTDEERSMAFSKNMSPDDPVQYVYGRVYNDVFGPRADSFPASFEEHLLGVYCVGCPKREEDWGALKIAASRLHKVTGWTWQFNAIIPNGVTPTAFGVDRAWTNAGEWKNYDASHPGLSERIETHYQNTRSQILREKSGKPSRFEPIPEAFKVDGRDYDIHISENKRGFAFVQCQTLEMHLHRQIRRVPSNFPFESVSRLDKRMKTNLIMATMLFNGHSVLSGDWMFSQSGNFGSFRRQVHAYTRPTG